MIRTKKKKKGNSRAKKKKNGNGSQQIDTEWPKKTGQEQPLVGCITNEMAAIYGKCNDRLIYNRRDA